MARRLKHKENTQNSDYRQQVNLVHVDRLVDSICQTVCGKENYEELCGDLLALRVIAQNDISIPEPVVKDIQMCMKSVLSRFKDEFAAIDGEGKSL